MRYWNVFFIAGLLSCSTAKQDGFVLRGTVPGAKDSTKVTLTAMDGSGVACEGYVVGEKFELRGKVARPTCCYLELTAKGKGYDFTDVGVDFFVENGELTFTTPHVDSLPMPSHYVGNDISKEKNYTVSGSAAQEVYAAFQASTAALRRDLKIQKRKMSFGRQAKYFRIWQKTLSQIVDVARKAVSERKNLYADLRIAEYLKLGAFTYDQAYLDELAGYFDGYADTCAPLREFRAYLNKAARFAIGQPWEDVELTTPEGKKVRMFDVLNKDGYTVFDFWASYCGPCRSSFPHVAAMEERYPHIKFVAVGTDQETGPWLKALKDEGLTHDQYFGGMQLRRKPESLYNVIERIPSYFVVDAQRRVLFYGNSSSALEAYIEDSGIGENK